eukprot:COSAG03_NODE_14294_length_469_cov_1.256757_1_plen_88_part_01
MHNDVSTLHEALHLAALWPKVKDGVYRRRFGVPSAVEGAVCYGDVLNVHRPLIKRWQHLHFKLRIAVAAERAVVQDGVARFPSPIERA